MSKPLTIEELKSLKVGDWVWVTYLTDGSGEYVKKIDSFILRHYEETWLAYKNKEMAESKDDEIRKQTAKEILQHFMGLPTCQHPTIGTGQFMFGKNYIRKLAKEYNVEVDE